jgi:chromate transporter
MTESGRPRASSDREAEARSSHGVGLIELFLLFSQLGLSSFGGGVSAWMHRAFVERRGWLGEAEFAAALALGRIMPGANVVNLGILIGQRLRGWSGAVAAALGLLVGPSIVVIAIASLYGQFAGSEVLHAVLEGAAAAAVGLLIAMGVQSGRHLIRATPDSPNRTAQSVGAIVVLIATFVAIGVLRFPMVPTVLCLAPLSILLTFVCGRSASIGDGHGGG